MILSDRTIRQLLRQKTLGIQPLDDGQIQPASVDIRLGDTYSIAEETSAGIVYLDSEVRYRTIRAQSYLLLPGQFVLATTMEYFRLPNDLTAFVEGRSSIGRLGLFIQNAGWVDPGFEGEITLELYNASRSAIELRAGRRVGRPLAVGRASEGAAGVRPHGRPRPKPLPRQVSGPAGGHRLPHRAGSGAAKVVLPQNFPKLLKNCPRTAKTRSKRLKTVQNRPPNCPQIAPKLSPSTGAARLFWAAHIFSRPIVVL